MESLGASLAFMEGGESESSYSRNSSFQKRIEDDARPVTKEAIFNTLREFSEGKFYVADLGCSSGPNVLSLVANVVSDVEEACRRLGRHPQEVQVYLNDLPGNDFNSVLSSLHGFNENREVVRAPEYQPPFYVAAVAGSFHGRLFPCRSIHLFHSSTSLHWLSKDPLKLQEDGEMVSNKESIHISKESPPSVRHAYARQFERDFSSFLRSRSAEVIVGGRMVLNILVREQEHPADDEYNLFWDMLSRQLNNMVHEGLIKKEDLEYFNVPIYYPLPSEIESQIAKEKSFYVEDKKIFEVNLKLSQDPLKRSRGEILANLSQAILGPLLARQFGTDVIRPLFLRLREVIDEDTSIKELKIKNLVVSMISKS